MWETILVQFKDAWIPKEWLSPTISIREIDWDLVVDWAGMTEIDNWRYSYEYWDYVTTRTYLIDADWWSSLSDSDRYFSNINELDSYQNKWAWKWPAVFIDYDKIAELSANKVWDEKTKDHKKKWTFWAELSQGVDMKPVLDEIKIQWELVKLIKIPEIEIPKIPEFNYEILIKAIENNKPELLNISTIIDPILKSIDNKEIDLDLDPIAAQIKEFDKWVSMNFNSIIKKLQDNANSAKDRNVDVLNKLKDKEAINELWNKIDKVYKGLKWVFHSINKNQA